MTNIYTHKIHFNVVLRWWNCSLYTSCQICALLVSTTAEIHTSRGESTCGLFNRLCIANLGMCINWEDDHTMTM